MQKELVKQAFKLGYAQAMGKSASPISDVVLSGLSSSLLGYPGAIVSNVGTSTGMMSNPATDKDIDEYDEHPGRAAIPGVGPHRVQRRLKKSLTDSSGNARHYISQALGSGTSTLLGSGLGALVGALAAGKKRRAVGAVVGGASGTLLPILTAGILALSKKRRGSKEHKKYIESSTVPEYFVPGMALYNTWKTIGHEQGKYKKRKQDKLVQQAIKALEAKEKESGE